MTDYKPGTVAKATVRGHKDVLVVRDADGDWYSPESEPEACPWHGDSQVTDVRPLVLLDLEDAGSHLGPDEMEMGGVATMLRRTSSATARRIADQIEAQTKPPRIPEPGLWGVVEAGTDGIPTRRWVHHEEDRWVCDTGERRNWEALSDPTLVREGVES